MRRFETLADARGFVRDRTPRRGSVLRRDQRVKRLP
jgi:hypothetical protein